ncbi:AAA family ATPase [Herbidospora cretacea]|uniref:AAA family ATPase n=1 Tax=Herbidospora cretacea TaxID=28444 RepID=UPI0007731FDE|nr:AAA family ATPase [Herbidospora cretacea]
MRRPARGPPLADRGLPLTAPVTFLVGENGSGKAETLFNLARGVITQEGRGFWADDLTTQSHGEGFFTVLDHMLDGPGLYLMDEPEAALSFHSCLRLAGLMHRVAGEGGQIICATHSPVLTGLPGAEIVELGDHGARVGEWAELPLVDDWRRFLARPDLYMRHITGHET